jgi:cytochrome c oxidase subunit 3
MEKQFNISKYRHPFHLVTPSPWPLYTAFAVQALLISIVVYCHNYQLDTKFIFLSFFFVLCTLYGWFSDVIFEATYQGMHTNRVQLGLRYGMILFILSEVCFFFSFFWAFFHSSLSPAIQIGAIWPPLGIELLNPWEIPLVNTLLLLLSGVWATVAHHLLKHHKISFIKKVEQCLLFAFLLGFLFSCFQFDEYLVASFEISDSVYGSVFYVATGFHGLHVIIGSIFLISMWFRLKKKHFQNRHFFGVEGAIWYWHFVDVVWLFLFVSIYWWGS